jgi:hypothetical protein
MHTVLTRLIRVMYRGVTSLSQVKEISICNKLIYFFMIKKGNTENNDERNNSILLSVVPN